MTSQYICRKLKLYIRITCLLLKQYSLTRWVFGDLIDWMQEFSWKQRTPKETKEYWIIRANEAAKCPDNEHIARVTGAGSSRAGMQTMHNGLMIATSGYYGYMMSMILEVNKGVHEPQEERVFQEILKVIPENGVMVEVGSNWAFYSLWFASRIKGARCIMVEPTTDGIISGKTNFYINGLKGEFIKAKIGSVTSRNRNDVPVETIDNIVKNMELEKIHILHADIQGFEIDLLNGCQETFKHKKINCIFVSTHSMQLHQNCLNMLLVNEYKIIASATPSQSYSVDGLVVACGPDLQNINNVPISKKLTNNK